MSNINILPTDEWAKLEELGFVSDYVHLSGPPDARIMAPIITAEQALAQGFYPMGTKVKWRPNAGYAHEEQQAQYEIGPDMVLTVKECRIGSSSSSYQFEEIDGQWNSVMFKKVED
jgi:hypothetical protein